MKAGLACFVLICGICVTSSSPLDLLPDLTDNLDIIWPVFKELFNKTYSSSEDEILRKSICESNIKLIEDNNQAFEAGESTFKMAVNQLCDLTPQEYENMLGVRVPEHNASSVVPETDPLNVDPTKVPASMNWTANGAVTPVKNQGSCGSCWSFSATGALEGQNYRKTGRLVSLSEQNLLDCSDSKYGNYGCNGGFMDNAFRYVADNNGIDTGSSYPYKASVGSCKYDAQNKGGSATGYKRVTGGDEQSMMQAVATIGPLSVAIDASKYSFRMYSGGVYNEPSCSTRVNHGVLVVGYGNQDGKDYWLVKNSWGTRWGERGYAKMARNANNQCGIASYASYPVV